MANEVANVDQYAVLEMDTQDLQEIISENLGGESLSPSDLDRVKIPSGGGTTWTIPDIDGERDEREIEGVVVFWKNVRAYWETEYDGSNNPPDCYSDDGDVGIGNPGGRCSQCPLSQWGSDSKGGKGQECKQMRLMFVLQETSLLPLVIVLPPTSLANSKKYFLRLASAGVPYWGVTTKFTLEKDKSEGGIMYSKATLSAGAKLSPEARAKVKTYADSLRPALQNVSSDEYVTSATGQSEDEEYEV